MRWGAAVPASRCTLRSFTSEAEIRRRRQNGSAPALKGHDIPAQGNALGQCRIQHSQALKGRDIITPPPLSQFRNCDRNSSSIITETSSMSGESQAPSPTPPSCHSFETVTETTTGIRRDKRRLPPLRGHTRGRASRPCADGEAAVPPVSFRRKTGRALLRMEMPQP